MPRADTGGTSRRVLRSLMMVAALTTSWSPETRAAGAEPALLVLSSFQANLPFPRSLERGMNAALEREGRRRPVYFEHLDADRFPLASHEDALTRLIHDKYADRDVGAMIAWGDAALGLIERHFETLSPPHVVATAVSDAAFERFRAHHPNTIKLTFPQDYAGSLRVAMDVSRADRLVVVGERGDGARRQWVDGVRAGWAAVGEGRELIDLTELPIAETLERIATFPPGTAFFALPMFHDARGGPIDAAAMAAEVTGRASGPVFSHWDPFLGLGIVGGKMLSGERMGAATVDLALATLADDETAMARATAASPYVLAFDGARMADWRIPDGRLPPDAVVVNRPPSLWNDYRWQVIAAAVVLTLLTATSAALLGALSARRRAMGALARERARLADRVRARTVDLDRKAEELTRSNRELESFAYAVSHDLRAPLRAVRSYIQLLMRTAATKFDDDEREFATHVRDGAGKLDGMIHGLLEYSRAGRREAEGNLDLSLPTIIREAVETMEIEIGAASAAVTVDAPETLPRLRANPINISRLLHNLIENALKYRHPDRAPVIAITARWHDSLLVLSVADNGVGIPAGQEERVFNLFQRLPGPADVPGHGVGLALCRRIVDACAGRLWVESSPGAGCVFHAAFPVEGEIPAHEAPTDDATVGGAPIDPREENASPGIAPAIPERRTAAVAP